MNKYRSINKVAKFSKPLLLSTLLLSCFNIALAKDYNNLVCAFPSANGLDGEYRWHVFNPDNYDYKAQRGADLQIDGAVKEFIDTTTGLWYGYQRAIDSNGKWLSYQELRNLCKDHAKSQYKGWISENTIPYMFTSYYGHDFKSDIWEMWVADAAQPSSPLLGTDIRKIITFGDSLSDDGNATYNASLRWYSTVD